MHVVGSEARGGRGQGPLSAEEEARLLALVRAGLAAARDRTDGTPAEQRAALDRRIAAGRDAESRLVAAYQGLARTLVRQIAGVAKVSTDDLLQEANVALTLAVRQYDPARSATFRRCAVFWVRRWVQRCAASYRDLIDDAPLMDEYQRLSAAWRARAATSPRLPTIAAVARDLGWDERRARHIARLAPPARALEPDDDAFATSDTGIARAEAALTVVGIVERTTNLTPTQRIVVAARAGLIDGEPWSLSRVADHLGVTKVRVAQLEKQALARLAAVAERSA